MTAARAFKTVFELHSQVFLEKAEYSNFQGRLQRAAATMPGQNKTVYYNKGAVERAPMKRASSKRR